MEVIKSVSYDQGEIIRNILTLHAPEGKIDVDPTYSKGFFYRDTGVEQPAFKSDINPVYPDVIKADSRCLPIESGTIGCEMFDPPFLSTTGKSLLKDDDSNKINKRFGVYPNEIELHQFYIDSMKEAHRILRDDGILIFKCQDKFSRHDQYMSHVFIMNEAVKIGFYPQDLFILLAKIRLVADWQARNQKHARKYHCYFWVFRKSDRKVQYV